MKKFSRNKIRVAHIVLKFTIIAVFILLAASQRVSAQLDWDQKLTWDQILKKAKSQNKKIFVDCIATWCGPCKSMDSLVYSQDIVIKTLEKDFIPIKLQFDVTTHDSKDIKDRYLLSQFFSKKYGVQSFPTYLFFSADGTLEYRQSGLKNVETFLSILNTAKSGEFIKELNMFYSSRRKNYEVIPSLMDKAIKIGNKELDSSLGEMYYKKYVRFLKPSELLRKDVLKYIVPYVRSEDKQVISIFYPYYTADTIIGVGFSKSVIIDLIEREIVFPSILKNRQFDSPKVDEPDWDDIKNRISRVYGEKIAEYEVLRTKRQWYYQSRPDPLKWAKATVEYYSEYVNWSSRNKLGLANINNAMSEIFERVSQKELLIDAAKIQRKVIERCDQIEADDNDNYMDTYANLLYRAGDIQSALLWQEKACAYHRGKTLAKRGTNPNLSFKENLEKMRAGVSTWK